jgi:hypothetical protein
MKQQFPWLHLAQIVWVILVGMTLGLYVLGGIVYFQELNQVCAETRVECHDRELATPEDVVQLQSEGLSLQAWAIANTFYRALITTIYCAMAFLIFARKRNEWSGLLFSYFLIAAGTLSGNFPALAAAYPVFALPVAIIQYMGYLMLPIFFATFPDGRVVPRVMWGVILFWGVSFFAQEFLGFLPRSNPLWEPFAAFLWLGMFGSGLAAQIYRYVRVSNRQERQQTKLVLFGIAILVISIAAIYLSPFGRELGTNVAYSIGNLVGLIAVNLLLMLIPITIGIAILRSRLFDIDVIIRRTVTYAVVVALLLVVYFGSVILLQRIFAGIVGDNSEIVTVLSTLAIAALFVPLRNRIQDAIDKRFNRQRYNAQHVLEKFAVTVRDETDLDKLSAELVSVVQETMQPKSVSVWFKKADYRLQTTDGGNSSSVVRRQVNNNE